jgi:CO/xanthine dehydrogenase FAD-binding subunit
MKPAPFEYFDPRTPPEAVRLLQQHGEDARVLAGGQSLVPLMNLRLVRPAVLVDINRIPALAYIRADGHTLAFGALTRIHQVATSAVVRERLPLLAEAAALVGHLAIRHRGTVGGNVAHADPASEIPAVILALDGELVAEGPRGQRTVKAGSFFTGLLSTALGPDELLTEVRVPAAPTGSGSSFVEVSRRDGDFALAGAAVLLRRGDGDRCTMARVALCGVAATALRVPEAERILEGQGISDHALRDAVERAVLPVDDVHASAEYRRHVAGVLVTRAVKQAWQRASQGGA